jgi:hypothetical protein
MPYEKQIRAVKKYNVLDILVMLIVGISIFGVPAFAAGNEFPSLNGGINTGYLDFDYWNPYVGWDQDLVSMAGIGIYPLGELDWPTETVTLSPPDSSVDHWVKLSHFPAGSTAGEPAILSGYVGGRNYNANVTIAGKKNSSDIFHNIITIRPQDNGVFVWAIPKGLDIVQFYQATATVGGIQAKSEIVSTSVNKGDKPISTTPTSIITSATTAVTTAKSLPISTSLTLSADSLHPVVGQEVTLTGRLTGNGKGISGATISIEVPDYGTDFLPLISTQTDSDGRFSATINTTEGGVVPVQAVFEGDDKYMSSTSNTLTFTAGTSSSSGIGFM